MAPPVPRPSQPPGPGEAGQLAHARHPLREDPGAPFRRASAPVVVRTRLGHRRPEADRERRPGGRGAREDDAARVGAAVRRRNAVHPSAAVGSVVPVVPPCREVCACQLAQGRRRGSREQEACGCRARRNCCRQGADAGRRRGARHRCRRRADRRRNTPAEGGARRERAHGGSELRRRDPCERGSCVAVLCRGGRVERARGDASSRGVRRGARHVARRQRGPGQGRRRRRRDLAPGLHGRKEAGWGGGQPACGPRRDERVAAHRDDGRGHEVRAGRAHRLGAAGRARRGGGARRRRERRRHPRVGAGRAVGPAVRSRERPGQAVAGGRHERAGEGPARRSQLPEPGRRRLVART